MRLIKKLFDKITYKNVSWFTVPMVCLGIFLLPAGIMMYLTWMSLLGAAILIAAIALSWSKWRCPHCGSMLGRSLEVPKHCHWCGKKLDGK
jgi:hypothetical protein